jgi:hypothetical protein
MNNIFWPVYQNLENEFNSLMFNIHIDDDQLKVYSSKISDLILRAAIEIESLSKELYFKNGGDPANRRIKYDEALAFLNGLWKLDKKIVVISSPNSYVTNRTLLPFFMNEARTGSARKTYSWNNAYQNLKHDRAQSKTFGSIKYLFDIMAALYLLNIYYRDEIYDLQEDGNGNSLHQGLGSIIYSIKVHKFRALLNKFKDYRKGQDFDECAYLIIVKSKVQEAAIENQQRIDEKTREVIQNHPKVQQIDQSEMFKVDIKNPGAVTKFFEDVIGKDEYFKLLGAAAMAVHKPTKFVYEAVLNKNQL